MIARAPAFWWRSRRSTASYLLWPAAWAWAAGARWRLTRPPRLRPPVAVVCIGNYVVGGAGKTPTVLALAALAQAQGLKPGILARGYGGTMHGPVLVDPERHRAVEVGDEALILAATAPTVVGADRTQGAKRLLAEGVDLILMDDGLQDPSLAKDVTIAVVDGPAGVGNGHVIPMGPLRAPLAAQIARTDALLVIGEGAAGDEVARVAAADRRRVLRGALAASGNVDWRTGRVLAFAGIGRPQKFFDSLAAAGATIAATRAFADHHRYSEAEAVALLAAAEKDGLRLVTTTKDAARLTGESGARGALRAQVEVFTVSLVLTDPEAVVDLLMRAVATVAGRRPT